MTTQEQFEKLKGTKDYIKLQLTIQDNAPQLKKYESVMLAENLAEFVWHAALSQPNEPIGETKDNGVIWYKQNPHAYPIGTKFYTSPPNTSELEQANKVLEAKLEKMRVALIDLKRLNDYEDNYDLVINLIDKTLEENKYELY